MSNVSEIVAGIAVEGVVVALAAGLILRIYGRLLPLPRRLFVPPFQTGVVVRRGAVERMLATGWHWLTPGRTLMLADTRPRPFQIQAQDLISDDGIGVRLSLGGEYRIIDPGAFVSQNSDSFGAFYLEVRQALRSAVEELDGQSVLSSNSPVSTRMKELLIPRAAQLGLEMTQLEIWEAIPIGRVRQI